MRYETRYYIRGAEDVSAKTALYGDNFLKFSVQLLDTPFYLAYN